MIQIVSAITLFLAILDGSSAYGKILFRASSVFFMLDSDEEEERKWILRHKIFVFSWPFNHDMNVFKMQSLYRTNTNLC